MTQFKPFIFLNRLIIKKDKHTVYDEKFHKGVNIIRGKNSVGKSTVMEFIYFALGGNIPSKQWKPFAILCTEVFAEVNINGDVFTLQRNVSRNSQEGMRIFQGDCDSFTMQDSLNFSYNSTDTKESYHDNLFSLMGISKVKSNTNNVINFSQVLRLIYTDQLTNVGRIFREEDFDSNFKREAIGDLILGISENSILLKKSQLRKLDKELTIKVNDIKSFVNLYNGIEQKSDIENLINENLHKIQSLTSLLEGFSDETFTEETKQEISEKRNLLTKLLEEKSKLIETLNKHNFEILDSEAFIKALEHRLIHIQESAKTLEILSDLEFSHCPSCFTKVKNFHNSLVCNLCGSPYDIEYESPTYRIKKNIEFQIQETRSLLPNFKQYSEEVTEDIIKINTLIDNCRAELIIMEKPIGGISLEKKKYLMEIGSLERENIYLADKLIQLDKFYNLQKERDDLQNQVIALNDEIKNFEIRVQKSKEIKESLIASKTLELIKQDLIREDSFENAREVTFSFSNDTIKVDGISLFSASSTSILKTCFKLAILLASCENKSFLYPRLAIMDNIEDKGMEEVRSQNLQKIIVRESEKLEVEHQIIFATSMIDSSLDNDQYCIGEFYIPENKTLKIST